MILGGLLAALPALAADPDLTRAEYYPGQSIAVPLTPQAKVFRPADRRAGFTAFEGVEDVKVENGLLSFKLKDKQAVLGWGNYQGRQPLADRVDLWEEINQVVLRVRLTGPAARWTMNYWRDGRRTSPAEIDGHAAAEITNAGNDWQDLVLGKNALIEPKPDGLELVLDGTPGQTVELESLKLVQPRHTGYIRKEFVLPEGEIWRAIAEVGAQNEIIWVGKNRIIQALYINGREVQRHGCRYLYSTAPVDIRPYLKPGTNTVAMYGYRVGPHSPFLYFQTRIIMRSGESVAVQTDNTWKYSPTNAPGWNQNGFNDAAWTNVDAGGSRPIGVYIMGAWGNSQLPQDPGPILIRNPAKRDLFYADDQALEVELAIPDGFQAQGPVLEYAFGRADVAGKTSVLKEGALANGLATNASLVYRLNLGRQPAGIYTIALNLKGQSGVLAKHPREPLVVIRKLQPKVIAGADWTDGLDLTLEDTIDFTNPQDPHPSIDSRRTKAKPEPAPLIIRTNGLVYRETTDYNNAYFSYRLNSFQKPGSFYLMELDYPDDADREMAISISAKFQKEYGAAQSRSGVGAETGGKFYNTGRMQKLRWLHVAGPGVHSVDIVNIGAYQRPGTRAAAAGLKIYRINGDLPSVGGGTNRLFGIQTERCNQWCGFFSNLGGRYLTPDQWQEETKRYSPLELMIRELEYYRKTTEHYVQYLRFCGQNTHVMGVIQYNEFNTPFTRAFEVDTARVSMDERAFLANTMTVNGMPFYAGVELSHFTTVPFEIWANDGQVAGGRDTYWMVDAQGRQRGWNDCVVPNWVRPEYAQLLAQLMRDLNRKFEGLSEFQGVWFPLCPSQVAAYWLTGFAAEKGYEDPFMYSYDDITFSRFAKETGVHWPFEIKPQDPKRFALRAKALENPEIRQRYRAWRCQKLPEFLAAGLSALREKRPELTWMNTVWIEDPGFYKYWLKTGRSYAEVLRDYGMDLKALMAMEGMSVGRWTVSWRQMKLGPNSPTPSQDPFLWLPKTDPRITGAFEGSRQRYVHVRTSWDEENYIRTGLETNTYKVVESDWIMGALYLRTLPQPGGLNCREAFIQAIIASDPDFLTSGFTDLNLNVGYEHEIRGIMNILTHLPRQRFQPVLNTGFADNLALRRLVQDGQTWFYAANPGYWSVRGEIVLSGKPSLVDPVTGRRVKTQRRDGKTILPVALEPYGLAAFRADQPDVALESYTTAPIDARERGHLENIMNHARELMDRPDLWALLSDDDRVFLKDTLGQAQQSLAANRVAQAWVLLTNWRFWSLSKLALEKMARQIQNRARLPEAVTSAAGGKQAPDGLRILTAEYTAEPVSLDGRLAEAVWSKTQWQTQFTAADSQPAMAEVAVAAAYDTNRIWLAFQCADPDVKKLRGGPRPSWMHDCLALFIQPDENKPVYYQLGFNASGAQFHRQTASGGEQDYQPLPGWQAVIATNAGGWTAEVVLPYSTFGLTGAEATSLPWRLNCHRIFRNKQLDTVSWSPLPQQNLNAPERFGRLEWAPRKP